MKILSDHYSKYAHDTIKLVEMQVPLLLLLLLILNSRLGDSIQMKVC